MISDINDRLQTLCESLGQDGLNYSANVRLYHAVGMVDRNLVDSVAVALGHIVVVGGARVAVFAELIESIQAGLEFAGDDGAHPSRLLLSSKEFRDQECEVISMLHGLLGDPERVVSFWLKEGHPFYPVFWEFAYLVEKGSDAFVLIGSSSD